MRDARSKNMLILRMKNARNMYLKEFKLSYEVEEFFSLKWD
jgi:hypothetical protein